jgi:hypothetical protein
VVVAVVVAVPLDAGRSGLQVEEVLAETDACLRLSSQ